MEAIARRTSKNDVFASKSLNIYDSMFLKKELLHICDFEVQWFVSKTRKLEIKNCSLARNPNGGDYFVMCVAVTSKAKGSDW